MHLFYFYVTLIVSHYPNNRKQQNNRGSERSEFDTEVSLITFKVNVLIKCIV